MPVISYGLDASQLTRGAKKAKTALGSIAKKAKGVGGSIAKMFSPAKVAFASLAGGFGVAQLAQTSDAYANMGGQLEFLTGSAEDAEEAQELLFQMSQKTRTSMVSNAAAFTRFSLASEQTGLTTAENVKVLGAINTKMIQTGVSSQEASSAMIQLGQALASGKLQGDEFRSMAENAPALMSELAKAMGVPRQALKEMGTAGELTSEVLGQAFLKMADSSDGMANKLPVTIGGMWTKVVNATERMWDKINDETGIMAWFAEGIDKLSKWVEENTPRIVKFFKDIGEKSREHWPLVKEYFQNMMKVATSLGKLFLALAPVVALVLTGIVKAINWAAPKIQTLIGWITTIIKGATKALKLLGLVGGGQDDTKSNIGQSSQNFFQSGGDSGGSSSAQQAGSQTNNQIAINVREKVSRSDITNIAAGLARQLQIA